jgi:beta-1,4-N-acetylglucosaminyltransferase
VRARRGARGEARVLTIGRAREVGQRWTTSAATTARACAAAIAIVARVNPDVVICNGPGTCVPIVLAAMARRALGWRTPATVFVESACRARTLSLTGKIFYHLRCVDRVCVMWERAHAAYPRSTFVGRAM